MKDVSEFVVWRIIVQNGVYFLFSIVPNTVLPFEG